MSRHHRVHDLLSRDELDALEAFAREPGRTVDEAHDWLLAKGYTLSRGAVHNWKRRFDAEDKVRRAAEVSRHYLEAVKTAGPADVAAASLHKFQTILFDHLLETNETDAGELRKLAMSLNTSVQAGRHIEALRETYETKEKRTVEEAHKTAKAGGSGEAVVNKVREILGIKEGA